MNNLTIMINYEMTVYLIFIFITAIYIILHFLFLIGFVRSSNLRKISGTLPKVSIIVAARNEENNISSCIESLKKIKYDENLLEIILVNDNSSDNTKQIMISETKGLNHFRVIESVNTGPDNIKGKPRAIDSAILISSGDIILMTDADCRVPENWALGTLKYYEENTQMVCGITKIKNDNSLFAKLQSLDWLYLLSLASCSSGIGKILSCIGNNLSFTKKVYKEIGGFGNISFSVTEDLALMRKINSIKSYNIKFPIDPDCIVSTVHCKNISELYRQKKRWFRGGFDINFLGWIMGFELYMMNVLFAFGYLFMSFNTYIMLILLKFISELLIIIPVYIKLKYTNLIYYYPLFQIFFAIYGLLLPFTFIFGKGIKWKERKL